VLASCRFGTRWGRTYTAVRAVTEVVSAGCVVSGLEGVRDGGYGSSGGEEEGERGDEVDHFGGCS